MVGEPYSHADRRRRDRRDADWRRALGRRQPDASRRSTNARVEKPRLDRMSVRISAAWRRNRRRARRPAPSSSTSARSAFPSRIFRTSSTSTRWALRFVNEAATGFDWWNPVLALNGRPRERRRADLGHLRRRGREREGWVCEPPHVDPNGWFFSGDTLAELAGRIVSKYQKQPMPAAALQSAVARYNSFVDAGNGCRLREALAQIQDPDAAVLRGVVDAVRRTTASRASGSTRRRR